MIDIDIQKRIKTYNGYHHLQVKTSFAVGGVTRIYGPSGAGKTTLLKILAGLIKPEEGIINVNGETWLDTSANICWPPQNRAIGFVFQDYALFPNMTVQQHLEFGTKNKAYIQRLIELGRMERFVQHKPKQLSGGQQQRLAILRALTTKPKLLLMDEPFSALDSALKVSLVADLKILLKELGITCLVVTHYAFETEGLAEYSFNME